MRILAGQFKGRNLLSPPGRRTTRPITGLVRKSLFDTLAPWLTDALVLDLFCGTGTIGLEALSRGARRCAFADRDRAAIGRLKRNIEQLGVADRTDVWSGDLFARLGGWLKALDAPVDLAFCDPPFAAARGWDWSQATASLFDPVGEVLAGDGRLVLRTPAGAEPPEQLGRLRRSGQKDYGDQSVAFFARENG